MSGFKKAERKRVFAKIATTGPSGAGKTWTSLLIARGMHGPNARIAVIDTENDSASLYAGRAVDVPGQPPMEFDSLAIAPPFHTKKYNEAMKSAVDLKYDVVIVDSGSHAWSGPGGILERKDLVDAAGGNKWTNWGPFTKEHNTFMAWILQSQIDVIFTMRSKQDYVLEQNANNKTAPKKVGMAPQQREGMEYEFSVVFDFDINRIYKSSKDRTGLFSGEPKTLDEEAAIQIGRDIAAWRASGKALATIAEPAKTTAPSAPAKTEQESHGGSESLINEQSTENLGDYVIKVGKHKGRSLGELERAEIVDTLGWVEKNNPRGGDWLEFQEIATAFVGGAQ